MLCEYFLSLQGLGLIFKGKFLENILILRILLVDIAAQNGSPDIIFTEAWSQSVQHFKQRENKAYWPDWHLGVSLSTSMQKHAYFKLWISDYV